MSRRNLSAGDRAALGQRLKSAREKAKLSQASAAERLELGAGSTLASYEQGDAEVPLSVLLRMPALYGVPVDALLGVAARTSPATEEDAEVERLVAHARARVTSAIAAAPSKRAAILNHVDKQVSLIDDLANGAPSQRSAPTPGSAPDNKDVPQEKEGPSSMTRDDFSRIEEAVANGIAKGIQRAIKTLRGRKGQRSAASSKRARAGSGA